VLLLYVDPQARFRGVSDALLAAMQAAARLRGRKALALDSTITALRFYTVRGFGVADPPLPGFGASRRHPLVKPL